MGVLVKVAEAVEAVMPPKFYDIAPIMARGAMYNVIYGERSNGKSYAAKDWILKEAFEKDRLFGLVFRQDGSKRVKELENYFEDLPISKITKGAADGLSIKAGEVHFTLEGKKVRKAGYVFFLSIQERYKSGTYAKVFNLLYEEFISKDSYLQNEAVLLDSLVSTVFRLRTGCRVIMLGNTISQVVPYVSDWGLQNLLRQAGGTIALYRKEFINPYKHSVEFIDIACEHTLPTGNQNLALSKRGRKVQMGEWEVDDAPKMTVSEVDECHEMHRFVVTYSGNYFLIKFLMDKKSNYFLYCERKTSAIQPKTRVVGDVLCFDNLYTQRFTPLVERERFVFNLLSHKKMYFCDDLTAANFWVCYNSILEL